MKNVKWCVHGCLLLFGLFKLTESKAPVVEDKNIIISDEDRRGAAEKVKGKERFLSFTDHKKADTTKRGIYLAAKHRIPGSLISPALRLTYNTKEKDNVKEASSQHLYEEQKFAYPDEGSKTGYEYYTPHYPAEYGEHNFHTDSGALFGHTDGAAYGHTDSHTDSALYGHTDNSLYGHTGSGAYEYPAADYTPSTGLGFENFKKSFGFKKFLLPLAGIALLGAAAALTVNPVLLQLGAITGKRRRRSIPTEELMKSNVYPTNEFVRPDKVRKLRKS